MLLKELFERDNVPCPEWLEYEVLDDIWEDSVCSFNDDKSTWSIKNPIQNLLITFDGEHCIINGFNQEGDLVLFERIITENIVITT